MFVLSVSAYVLSNRWMGVCVAGVSVCVIMGGWSMDGSTVWVTMCVVCDCAVGVLLDVCSCCAAEGSCRRVSTDEMVVSVSLCVYLFCAHPMAICSAVVLRGGAVGISVWMVVL